MTLGSIINKQSCFKNIPSCTLMATHPRLRIDLMFFQLAAIYVLAPLLILTLPLCCHPIREWRAGEWIALTWRTSAPLINVGPLIAESCFISVSIAAARTLALLNVEKTAVETIQSTEAPRGRLSTLWKTLFLFFRKILRWHYLAARVATGRLLLSVIVKSNAAMHLLFEMMHWPWDEVFWTDVSSLHKALKTTRRPLLRLSVLGKSGSDT